MEYRCKAYLANTGEFNFEIRRSAYIIWYYISHNNLNKHHRDVIMSAITSQITDASIVCLTVCSGADERKHQRSASLPFVRRIHRWPVDSPDEV